MNVQAGPDLGAVIAEQVSDEFIVCDVAASMTTMTDDPRLLHLPTGVGGTGYDAVAAFYREQFIGQRPAHTAITQISRTVDCERVIDGKHMRFTADQVIQALMPGGAPTGGAVELLVVGFGNGKVDSGTCAGTRRVVKAAASRPPDPRVELAGASAGPGAS